MVEIVFTFKIVYFYYQHSYSNKMTNHIQIVIFIYYHWCIKHYRNLVFECKNIGS